jgi:hypothetical protein
LDEPDTMLKSYGTCGEPSFELNEVPWEIPDDCVAARPASALTRVLAGSRCHTSMPADRGHLSPASTTSST